MPQISIIVPVYNVEAYICRCVDSILAQTFTDFELILVDDGSPDNCGAICDEYAKRDFRVKTVHKDNGGLASARNAGLLIANGKYVLFCDSDDYVSHNWCEHLYLCAEENPSLLIFGNYHNVFCNGEEERLTQLYKGKYSWSDFFEKNLPGFAWDKAFRLSILRENHLMFPEDVIIEDLPFVVKYLEFVDGLYGCENIGYCYYHDDRETLSKKYYPDGFRKWREKYSAESQAIERLIQEENRLKVKKKVAQKYLFYFLSSLDNTFDKRNQASFLEKMKYNQRVVSSKEFQDSLQYANPSIGGKRYIKWLKKRNYLFAYSIKKMSAIKKRL